MLTTASDPSTSRGSVAAVNNTTNLTCTVDFPDGFVQHLDKKERKEVVLSLRWLVSKIRVTILPWEHPTPASSRFHWMDALVKNDAAALGCW